MLHVILLHGLGAHGITLSNIEQHVRQFNIRVHVCSYLTFFNTIEQITKDTSHYCHKNIPVVDPIIIIGHSLGGIIARHLTNTLINHNIQTVLTLGAPHNGAILATKLIAIIPFIKKITIVRQLAKKSIHLMTCPHIPTHIRHINIVGVKKTDWINPINWITSLLLLNQQSHDGVVEYDSCLSTRNDEVHELQISHIGMLLSIDVERIISYEIYKVMKDFGEQF